MQPTWNLSKYHFLRTYLASNLYLCIREKDGEEEEGSVERKSMEGRNQKYNTTDIFKIHSAMSLKTNTSQHIPPSKRLLLK